MYVINNCSDCACLSCIRRIDDDCQNCKHRITRKFVMCENYMSECSACLDDSEF